MQIRGTQLPRRACAGMAQFCAICCTPQAPKLPAPRSTRNPRREIRKWLYKKLRPEDLDDDSIWADNNPARPVTFDPANNRKYNAQVHTHTHTHTHTALSLSHSSLSLSRKNPRMPHTPRAQVYFRKDPKEGARTALERWQMSDPQRGAKAQMAYDDFLFGLEVGGCALRATSNMCCPDMDTTCPRTHDTCAYVRTHHCVHLQVIGQQEHLVGTHGKGNMHTTGRQIPMADRAEILQELVSLQKVAP